MKLWHTVFIGTYILVYGTLSLVLLGSWVVEVRRAFTAGDRVADGRMRRRGALIGATVLASAVTGLCILAFRGFP